MKLIVALFLLLIPEALFALACCAGGNAKSFVSVKSLQKYELGVATSFRDVYGIYNRYGEIEEFAKNQTMSLALGVATRLSHSFQVSLVVPLVHRYFEAGASGRSTANLGDVLAGLQYTVVEPVFHEDWYPTISTFGFIKFPSGSMDRRENGVEVPGTGNGLWEPSIGVQLEKPISFFTVTLRASYNWRLARGQMKEGDSLEFMESLSVPIGRRLLIAGGATQSLFADRSRSGEALPNSSGRLVSLFFTPSYFISQEWSVSAGAEFAIPLHGWGKNQPAAQSVSVAARYALF